MNTAEIDRTNRLPDEVVNEIKDKGLLKILRPKMFGGYETNMRTYTEVVTEIARGNGSAGWFVCLSNIRDYMISYTFGEKALNEIYTRDDIVLAGNFKPIRIDIEKWKAVILLKMPSGHLFPALHMQIGATSVSRWKVMRAK